MTTHGLGLSVVVFAVSLLVGGLAVHVGAMFAFASGDYSDAVVTALLGAVAWALVDIVLSSSVWAGCSPR